MHRSMRRTLAVVATAAAFTLMVSACSSGETNNTSEEAGGGVSAELLEEAASIVATATELEGAEFPIPTEAFDPGTGTAAVLAGGFVAPIHFENANITADAFTQMGWDVLGPYDGEFNPSVQGGYVDQAVQDGADAIVIMSTDIDSIPAAVDRALEAGVSVGCVMCYVSDEWLDKGVINASVDFNRQGELMAWYLIDRNQGNVNAVVTDEPAAPTVTLRVAGLQSVLDEQCPDTCSYITEVIPANDSTLPGPPQWTAVLAANPEGITDGIAYYDGLSLPMVNTVESSGRGEIVVSGYDADEPAVELLRQGNENFGATLAAPYEFADWAVVDLVARAQQGLPLWDSANIPSAMLTVDNAKDFTPYFGPSGDWQSEFLKVWGK